MTLARTRRARRSSPLAPASSEPGAALELPVALAIDDAPRRARYGDLNAERLSLPGSTTRPTAAPSSSTQYSGLARGAGRPPAGPGRLDARRDDRRRAGRLVARRPARRGSDAGHPARPPPPPPRRPRRRRAIALLEAGAVQGRALPLEPSSSRLLDTEEDALLRPAEPDLGAPPHDRGSRTSRTGGATAPPQYTFDPGVLQELLYGR